MRGVSSSGLVHISITHLKSINWRQLFSLFGVLAYLSSCGAFFSEPSRAASTHRAAFQPEKGF
jgi:hypothetical protein